ncbi:MAG TPA: protoporphyrinogen oxidase [Candidatus Acidoferrales bacterium]|nr:protoporphyrinogen oxidase [Candidatus Acidoferrales bacterium]
MTETSQAVVIGGGISGLACAYRLRKSGIGATLLEAAVEPGGLVSTIEKDGFLFEAGPQSFQGTDTLSALFRELGIEKEVVIADPKAPRFVYRHGRLHKIPMSPQALVTSSLLGAGSRWKIASEAFRKTSPPNEEETIANFVRRKFGHEILEYLVAPFVSGVYAGDPERLSLRAAFPTLEEWEREYGSVLRGAMKSRPPKGERKEAPPLCSFRRGLRTMMQSLASKLGGAARWNACVNAIARDVSSSHSGFDIQFEQARQNAAIRASALIFATPAYAASHLVGRVSHSLAAILSGIAYAPVVVVAGGYQANQFQRELAGFGFLVPRSERQRTLGTVFNSILFPGRAGDGAATITSFVGGATDPEIINLPEEEIAAIVEEENAKVLHIEGPPVARGVWKHPKALPQYNLGHGHAVQNIRDAEGANPGLFFTGNYLEGPALGKCVEAAFQTADTAANFLQSAR